MAAIVLAVVVVWLTMDRGDDQSSAKKKTGPAARGPWFQIVTGAKFTCGLNGKGRVTCWGKGASGVTPPAVSFSSITGGGSHVCGLKKADSTVACWGDGFRGSTRAPAGPFSKISAGWDYTCGIKKTDSSVVCWGWNKDGQTKAHAGAYRDIAAGYHHTCGIKTDGAVVCWGANRYGQSNSPGGRFEQIVAAKCHTCGLRAGGKVQCWGCSPEGLEPKEGGTAVTSKGRNKPPAGKYIKLSAGYLHTCAITDAGAVKCWGHDAVGQSRSPQGTFSHLAAGFFHTCGILEGGALRCWGWREPFDTVPQTGRGSQHEALPNSRGHHTCPYEGLGLLYLHQGRKEKAAGSLGDAMSINANTDYKKLVQMARRYIKQGKKAEARIFLRKARNILIENPVSGGPSGQDRCAAGQVYRAGRCVRRCSWRRPTCPKNEICDLLQSFCVVRSAKAPCSTAADCPSGQRCFAHGCVASCEIRRSTCPAGQFCTQVGRFCRPLPRACSKNADCKKGHRCHVPHRRCYMPCSLGCPEGLMCGREGALCRLREPPCGRDSDCPAGKVCTEQACAHKCSVSSSKCPAGYACDHFGETCRTLPAKCASNKDCGRTERCYLPHRRCYLLCRAGKCPPSTVCDAKLQICRSLKKPCTTDADCPGGGLCAPRGCMSRCSATTPCPAGEQCHESLGICE